VLTCLFIVGMHVISADILISADMHMISVYSNVISKLNIIYSVHLRFYVYCPTNAHIYSLLIV
jgi:hypothetical protein